MKISLPYLELLKKEGDKAVAICKELNGNNEFKKTVTSTIHDNAQQGVAYKAEHVLLHDIVKIVDDFIKLHTTSNTIETKIKFILVYFYEKLQGKDLSAAYDLPKINQLVVSSQFDKNVSTIRETSFFEPAEILKTEFVLPSILSKIGSDQLLPIGAFLHRIASLIVNADGKINEKEKGFLKQTTHRINHPKIFVQKASVNEVPENDTLEIVLGELNELIGLDAIKKNVEDLTNFLKIQKIREEKGLKASNNTLHAVFMGPPGTGKTTVARMLGRMYKHLGYLEKGHLVETDRAGMVAGYVGQTAIKADEIIKSALGGVLFIDEAYSLTSGGLNDFGTEAIEVLLKRMEDHRDNIVVVVAGYPDEMQGFIQTNPGLQSRFNRYFEFDHFTAHALLDIFKLFAKKADFKLTPDAEEKLMEILDRVYEKRHRGFGNARTIRNLFEKIIERQANRIVSITPITEEILMTLTEDDIPEILKTVKEIILFDEDEE
ncbi:AAA family ATPase [Aquimarina aquimarini]|uniref:AAA family ATPase n=1 Tax=Aquimarina aquimarini TaxID=1191734 RepID=UPI001901E6AD|nr:AAA family ATPase [Aquimarina aquimarini]